MNEGGIRVPMIVRWPRKIKAGSESDLPWYFPDVMPTLTELAGVTQHAPENIDGLSVVPTLLGEGTEKQHEYFFWRGAIRMGNWKGIGKSGRLKLYDLAKDVSVEHNHSAKHPEIVAKLSELMEQAWTPPRSQADDGGYGNSQKKFAE